MDQKQGSNQILRIQSDHDLDLSLDSLFKAAMQPKSGPGQVPMRLRNLPRSFFQQPDGGGSKSASHSRESSIDNTYSPPPTNNNVNNNNAVNNNNTVPQQGHNNGLPVNHPRAHSSPASLQQTLSVVAQHQHLRQQSYDITDNIPLPSGWEMAKTPAGQTYFLNHLTQTTTWEDPRKKLSAGSLSNSSGIACSSPSSSPATSLLNLQNLGPLPDGWDQSKTAEGDIYFINHKTRTTSWYDPRIPLQLQQPHIMAILGQPNVPLPAPNISAVPQPSTVSASLPTLSSQALQQQQQKLRLQRLEMERERLRLRNIEILRAAEVSCFPSAATNVNDMLRRNIVDSNSLPTSPMSNSSDSRSVDPFIGADADFHSRQESSDSGLGLGPNYSLPNTPEDYLMAEETSSTDDVLLDIAELNLDTIPGATLDMVPEHMDSEDLEPSLQEELTPDLLSDVEALLDKEDALKWL